MKTDSKNAGKALLRKVGRAPKLSILSVQGYFKDRMATANSIAQSKHMDVETKLRFLKTLHKQMNLASSFIYALLFGLVGAILFWAIFQDGYLALFGWTIVGIILFVSLVAVRQHSFNRAVGAGI
ncbi:MAG: hypothetical protein JSV43_03795 [Methanobacteriota archaeon]|nr:MAG: hypothetical protein JSV43_03795 [Euryarchaeota archaeon]